MSYSYDRTSSTKLQMGPGRLDARATEALQKATLKAKSDGRTLNGAALQAGFYAKKMGKTMVVYEGNSNMHKVFRVSDKPAEYLDPINNMGDRVLSVTPDLQVSWHDITRP